MFRRIRVREPDVLRVPKGACVNKLLPCYAVSRHASSAMDTGFQFEFLWNDNDVFEIRVAAWNGQFGGSADVYVPIGGLAEAAAKLEGFPHQPSDTREIQFGAFGREWAGGGVSMRFYCKDGAGHGLVEARIESDYRAAHTAQSALLFAYIEAAAVDTFVTELRCLETKLCGTALLRASGPP